MEVWSEKLSWIWDIVLDYVLFLIHFWCQWVRQWAVRVPLRAHRTRWQSMGIVSVLGNIHRKVLKADPFRNEEKPFEKFEFPNLN